MTTLPKYLYLTHEHWADSWVSGGVVPLNLASTYKRMERSGIYTPDENLIYQSKVDLPLLRGALKITGDVKNVRVGEIVINGRTIVKDLVINRYTEDGLILSLCNRKSRQIASRLEKRAAVRIDDLQRLKAILDEQIGLQGIAGPCEYTSGHERNHFLKSNADEWQDEYRIFWAHNSRVTVKLPPGIARRIKL